MTTVYLIGICGTGMATLAALLKASGVEVRGSDAQAYPPMDSFLAEQGITPALGYDAAHITDDVDLVVIGNAVSRGNPEVEAVLAHKIRYCSLPEMVRDRFLWGDRSLVVAGTHGKTTTTSMVAWTLVEAGVDPSFLIGGVPRNFEASFRRGAGGVFVIEGDEYDSAFFDKTAKFLKYLPEVVIVGSVEYDHADLYADLAQLQQAFERLLQLMPASGRLILGVDDLGARRLRDRACCAVDTFGLSDDADWRAVNVRYELDVTVFDVCHGGATVAQVALPMLGTFNVRNALAACAAASTVGVTPEFTARALARFKGVRRRLEVCGVEQGVTVYDDFAHHPTAVRETLVAIRAAAPAGRVWAVFEPRSATACRRVFQTAFASALALADSVIVGTVYRSTIPFEERLSEARLVDDLAAAGVAACHLGSAEEIAARLAREANPGDVVVVMSNGDFGGVQERILHSLRSAH